MYLTLGGLGHPERADDLADAVFGANAVRPHVPALDDLGGGDLCVRGLCGDERGEVWLVWQWSKRTRRIYRKLFVYITKTMKTMTR